MLMEEGESEIGWLFWDFHFSYLLEEDYNGLAKLLALDGAYSEHTMRDIYTSVGEEAPCVINAVAGRK